MDHESDSILMADDTTSHEIHQPSGCVQTIEKCPEGRPCPKSIEAQQLRLCLDAEARGSPNGLGLLGHGFGTVERSARIRGIPMYTTFPQALVAVQLHGRFLQMKSMLLTLVVRDHRGGT